MATEQDDGDTPYKNIVALNEHAAILHHIQYSRRAGGEAAALLIDAGATHNGYASDITRTQVKGTGPEATLFGRLIDAVEKLQQSVIAHIRVGAPYEALHDTAHELLAVALTDCGLCHGSSEALVDLGVTRAFFPHGLGHSLGIQVHDVGLKPKSPAAKNPFLRHTGTIAAGQVFTIEPGCYFIEALLGPLRSGPGGDLVNWSTVDSLRRFGGIRIEDNVFVGAVNVVNLTRDAWPT